MNDQSKAGLTSPKQGDIKSIRFGLITHEFVKNTFEIKNGFSTVNGMIKPGGLSDTHLGTTSSIYNCSTCGLGQMQCDGHFGHFKIFNDEFIFNTIGYSTILNILSVVCVHCGVLLVQNQKEILDLVEKVNPVVRLSYLKKETARLFPLQTNKMKKLECPSCCNPIPKVIELTKKVMEKEKKDKPRDQRDPISFPLIGGIALKYESSTEIKDMEIMTAKKVYLLFRKFTPDIVKKLGMDPVLSHPVNFVMNRHIVAPPAIRPTTISPKGASDHIFTKLYINMIKANSRSSVDGAEMLNVNTESMSREDKDVQNLNQIQKWSISLIDSSTKGSLQVGTQNSNQKAEASLGTLLGGKTGLIRQNANGKRTNQSARSVITGNPLLDIDQVGVPIEICKQLSRPEVVTLSNIQSLQKLVDNKGDYPGALSYLQKSTGNTIVIIPTRTDAHKIQVGDVVDRHLMADDIILLNRQPSLHKMSMMGLRVKPVKEKTIQINPCIVTPYNADFDGDEMNIMNTQLPASEVEVQTLAMLNNHIVSAGTGRTIINPIQDSVTGIFLLSQDNVTFSRSDTLTLLNSTGITLPVEQGKDTQRRYTNKEIIKMCFPQGFSLKTGSIEIEDGMIISSESKKGYLTSDILKTIIQKIFTTMSKLESKRFIERISLLANNYMHLRSYSLDRSSFVPTPEDKLKAEEIITNCIERSNEKFARKQKTPDLIDSEQNEIAIAQHLNAAKGKVEEVLQSNDLKGINKPINAMIISKSKGKPVNLVEIRHFLGQQNIETIRIPANFNNRSLPCFTQFDESPEARGFIRSSFFEGLTPQDFIFHAQSGRVGIVYTGKETANTGYVQRNMVKTLEDTKVGLYNWVTTERGAIIQFSAGRTGFDSQQIEQVQTNMLLKSDSEIRDEFGWNDSEESNRYTERMIEYREKLRFRALHFDTSDVGSFQSFSFNTCINFQSLLDATQKNAHNPSEKGTSEIKAKSDLNPVDVINEFDAIFEHPWTTIKPIKEDDDYSKFITKALLHEYCHPKKLISMGYTKSELLDLRTRILRKFVKSLVDPGKMIGIEAAQSLGEPTTQMTLNTFHRAGTSVGSSDTNQRPIDLLKEILNQGNQTKNAIMIIRFKEEYTRDKEYIERVKNALEMTYLSDIIEFADILYDPNVALSDRDQIEPVENIFSTNEDSDIKSLPWLLRIKLNRTAFLEKGISMLQIKQNFVKWLNERGKKKVLSTDEKSIVSLFKDHEGILSSDDNDPELFLHIRLNFNKTEDSEKELLVSLTQYRDILVSKFLIKGITGISKVTLHKENTRVTSKNPDANYEYILKCQGLNMLDIRYFKGIDLSRTETNNIRSTWILYGIEAARKSILQQLISIFSGQQTSLQHYTVLTDYMTYTGDVIAVSRHGMAKMNKSPLSKMSFEEVKSNVINAAIYAQKDELNGVSASIIVGQKIKGGTGMCEVGVDLNKIIQVESSENQIVKTLLLPSLTNPLFNRFANKK
jgi:DNA-directed RNA polymerase II subunit RPB1